MCVNVTVDPFTVDPNPHSNINDTVVLHIRNLAYFGGFIERHYRIVRYPIDKNVKNCIFIRTINNIEVTIKLFLIAEELGLVFLCGYYKNSPDPFIMVFSRNRRIDPDVKLFIVHNIHLLGYDNIPSWTDQSTKTCSSVRLVAPSALLLSLLLWLSTG